MALDPIISLVLGSGIVFVTGAIILLIWWFIATSIMRPLTADKYVDVMVEMEITNFWLLFFRSITSLPGLIINTFFTLSTSIMSNIVTIVVFMVLVGGSLVWLEYHNPILETYYVGRTCYAMPVIYTFGLPVFNVITMIYDSCITVVDFYVNLHAFYAFGLPIILFKCAINSDIGNVLFYFSNLFSAFFSDFNNWMVNGFLTAEWNILISLKAFGQFVDTLPPIFNCFCSIADPVYEAIDLFCNHPAVHYFINCFFNFFVRLWQLVIATLQFFITYILPGPNPVKPDFKNLTLDACCALENGGDAIEGTVFIVFEMLWGIFGNPSLPPELLQILSLHYMTIVTHPLCGIARTANMTATLLMNINDGNNGFLNPDGSGIQYLQFGHVADKFREACVAFGSIFYILNDDARHFAENLALCFVDIAAFISEWVPGNIMFFIYAQPSDVLPNYPSPTFTPTIYRIFNFLFYYFPNYWNKAPPGGVPMTVGGYTYSNGLSLLYDDSMAVCLSAGNLVGLVNNALGCAVEHAGKSIITFLAAMVNFISFFFPIIFFLDDVGTTARAVDVDKFFLEASYLSGCLGELVSQFGNCTPTQNDSQDNLYCCTGRLITQGIDTFLALFQQLFHFFQDIVTLPTDVVQLCLFGNYNPSNTTCVRIPNLAGPIYKLNTALCSFSCALANVVPVVILFNDFNCVFGNEPPIPDIDQTTDTDPGGEPGGAYNPLPIVPCSSVTSCIANVICTVLQVFTVPLTILNQFFIQIIQGNPFTNLYDFLNSSAVLIATALGNGGDAMATLVDCAICAFGNTNGPIPTTNYCSTTFYTIMHYLFVIPFVALAGSFGVASFYVTRLFMSSLNQIFNGLGYFGISSFISKLFKFSGIYSYAASFWFTNLFSSLGLTEIAAMFNAIEFGLCEVLQSTLEILITEVAIVSLGLASTPPIFMCCGIPYCIPFKKRFDIDSNDNDNISSSIYNNTFNNGFKRSLNNDTVQYYDPAATLLTPDTWIQFLLNNYSSVFKWSDTDTCGASMAEYKSKEWQSFTKIERWHVFFCFYKVLWPLRTDNQTRQIYPSKCDNVMTDFSNDDWMALRYSEKADIMDCIYSRYLVDGFRSHMRISWLPQDWLSNPWRKYYFLYDLFQSSKIYFQYMMDHSTSPTIMLSQDYQNQFRNLGLNMSYMSNITMTDDILIMRSQFHMKDYFIWNNATNYAPIEWVSTKFFDFIDKVASSMSTMSGGFGDTVTDPTVYLQYGYTGPTPSAVGDGLVFYIVSTLLNGISKFAKIWADPVNLRKRDGFFSDASNTLSNIVNGTSRQANMMTIEFIQSLNHTIELYAGNCNVNETREFMYEYEKTIQGLDDLAGKRSMSYRLSQWWTNLSMPNVHTNYKPRDGKYRSNGIHSDSSKLYHTYKDEHTGEMKQETMVERIFRFIALIRKGTDASNYRVNKLSAGFSIIKNRFYIEMIKRRIDDIQTMTIPIIHEDINTYMIQQDDKDKNFHSSELESDTVINDTETGTITYRNFNKQREIANYNVLSTYDELCRVYSNLEECLVKKEHKVNNNVFYTAELTSNRNDLSLETVSFSTAHNNKQQDLGYIKLLVEDTENIIKNIQKGKKSTHHIIGDKVSYSISSLRKSKLLNREFTTNGLVHMDSLLDLTCTSNISFLCTECFYLDQAVGRVLHAIRIPTEYYNGQYKVHMAQSMDFFAYEVNQSAYARLGDSRELPARWPWLRYNNLRILGDDTPNKTRIDDILAMVAAVSTSFDASLENSTLFSRPDDYGTINGAVFAFMKQIPGFKEVVAFFYSLVKFILGSGGISTAQTSVVFIVENWVVCDWNIGSAFTGLHKRFSIGETVVGFIVVFYIIMFIGIFVFRIDLWAVVTGTSLSLMIFVFTFLNITYNWAWLCWPGLPYQLMKDINYFFVNTLFTKCDWLFSGLVLNEYTNANCPSCLYATNITMVNCQDIGFTDITANIIFTLEYFSPDTIQWLRDTTLPIYMFYQIPFVNSKLNAFANVDMTNSEENFAMYWTCNVTITLIPNLIILAFFLTILSIIAPIFSFMYQILSFILTLFLGLLFILYYILQSFFIMVQMHGFTIKGLLQTYLPGSDNNIDDIGDGSFNNEISNRLDNNFFTSPSNLSSYIPPSPSTRNNRIPQQSSSIRTMRRNNRTDEERLNRAIQTKQSLLDRRTVSNASFLYNNNNNNNQDIRQRRMIPQQSLHRTTDNIRPLEYNSNTNTISLEHIRNVLSRTGMPYFGTKKTK